MTKEQVNALREAGISESAIIDRILGEEKPVETPETSTDVEKRPFEASRDTKPVNVPEDKADAILAAIERLTGAIRTSNSRTGRDTPSEKSVEDIMAEVLTPKK